MNRWLLLAIFLAVTLAAGATGSIFMPGQWYAELNKPDWTPPNWLFAPVWTVLYVMIATAGWLAARAKESETAIAAWIAQLLFASIWSWVMFELHRIDLALIDIVAMWLAIGAFVAAAWPVSRPAALLFLPYWAWVTFALALNFRLWQLNP